MQDRQQAINTIAKLLEEGVLQRLLADISENIALEIVESFPNETNKREELYMLNQALKRLNDKLQEYANIYNSQE